MRNYSQRNRRHINRALDMLLDDLANPAIPGPAKPLPAPTVRPGGENAAAGRETADKSLLDVADDACGDAYLSEGRVYP